MKKLILAVTFVITAQYVNAQNTFPATGNVGIGTTTPVFRTHVAQDITMDSDITAGTAQLSVGGATNMGKRMILGYDTNGNGFGFIKAGNLGVVWTSLSLQPNGGNVGIGTTTPAAKLSVVGDIHIDNLDWTTDNALRIREGSSSAYGAFFKYGLNDLLTIGTRNADVDYVAMQVSRGSLNTIFNGNVGIGTTIPSAKLEVNGNSELFGGSNKIYGNHDSGNYYMGHYPVNGSDGLDIHWYGGVRLGDSSGTVLQVTNGNVGIGTTTPDEKLAVNGTIHSREVRVDLTGWPDYVFEKHYTGKSSLMPNYSLPTLKEIEAYTKANHHLPEVPSATEITTNGLKLGEMNGVLLQKIEELTLYAIDQENKNDKQNKIIEVQNQKIEQLEKDFSALRELLKPVKK